MKKMDYTLNLIVAILAIISVVFIYSSSTASGQYTANFAIKQAIFYVLGAILMFVISKFDFEQLKKISWYIYFIVFASILLLIIAPESIARPVNGAKAWYQIKYIGTIQPSEFLKVAFVILLSKIVVDHQRKVKEKNLKTDMYLLVKIALITLPPMLVVYEQPDTGMIMLYMSIIIPIIYFSGISNKILFVISSIPIIVLSTLIIMYFKFYSSFEKYVIGSLSPHQQPRITGWLHPFENGDASLQTRNSLLAIGSGELEGNGFLKNEVYIPEKHTDFIFATIGEEFGFIGSSFTIILFFLLIYRIIYITQKANDNFAYLMCSGIVGLLLFQVFQNIGMTIGLLPVTGVTLPFLSNGGSSLLSNMMLIGFVHSIKKSYSGYMFTKKNLSL